MNFAWRGLRWVPVFISIVCCFATPNAIATGPNSWTSQVTGAWEDLSWSLGVRPDISQSSVLITNYGQKAVILGPNARDNFPASLSISNLVLAGTPLSTNTLLLNFIGSAKPLRIYNSLAVLSNAVLLNLSSSLGVVGGMDARTYFDGGTLNQTGGSNYFEGIVFLGPTNDARVNVTNAVMIADQLFVGYDGGATFNQIGGNVLANYFRLGGKTSDGNYVLSNGVLSATTADIGPGFSQARFTHSSGTFAVSNSLSISGGYASTTHYTLNSGLLQSQSETMGAVGSAIFVQNGGTHISGNIGIGNSYPGGPNSYTLAGGALNCTGLAVDSAVFDQSGGTNAVAGGLGLSDAVYHLSAGELYESSCYVGADREGSSQFNQSGGRQIVTNTLQIFGQSMGGGGPVFFLQDGVLDCGQLDIGFNGTFQHTGGSLTVHGMATLGSGAKLVASNVTEQFGPLMLSGDGARFDQISDAVQHFASSADLVWDTNSFLIINPSGAVYFGNSRFGLTPRQQLQISFMTGGDYVKLLDDGQLVPWPVPPIDVQLTSSNLVLNWTRPSGLGNPGTIVLQAADNVAGPYVDVPNATSPYMVPLNSQAKFFRLTRH